MIEKPIYTMSVKMVKSAMPPRLKAVNIHDGRLGKCEAGVAAACHLRDRERWNNTCTTRHHWGEPPVESMITLLGWK